MSTRNVLDNFLREVHEVHFKEFEDDVVRRHHLLNGPEVEREAGTTLSRISEGYRAHLPAFDREQDKELKSKGRN